MAIGLRMLTHPAIPGNVATMNGSRAGGAASQMERFPSERRFAGLRNVLCLGQLRIQQRRGPLICRMKHMGSTSDKVSGLANQAAGKVKEGIGKATVKAQRKTRRGRSRKGSATRRARSRTRLTKISDRHILQRNRRTAPVLFLSHPQERFILRHPPKQFTSCFHRTGWIPVALDRAILLLQIQRLLDPSRTPSSA